MKIDVDSCRPHHYDYWQARGAILLAAALNAFLINDLTLIPSSITSCLELALLVPLSIATATTNAKALRAHTEAHWTRVFRHRQLIRVAAIVLTALISAINFESLFGVLHALLYGAKGATGQTLLIDALNIWITNVIVFALWFWNLDRGGPVRRLRDQTVQPDDFQFPQTAGKLPGYPRWTPGFFDYVFVSYTNATAFSPTDTMPLSIRAKLLFMVQSFASLLTVGLLAARAVNILS